jgi:hypothetical protein
VLNLGCMGLLEQFFRLREPAWSGRVVTLGALAGRWPAPPEGKKTEVQAGRGDFARGGNGVQGSRGVENRAAGDRTTSAGKTSGDAGMRAAAPPAPGPVNGASGGRPVRKKTGEASVIAPVARVGNGAAAVGTVVAAASGVATRAGVKAVDFEKASRTANAGGEQGAGEAATMLEMKNSEEVREVRDAAEVLEAIEAMSAAEMAGPAEDANDETAKEAKDLKDLKDLLDLKGARSAMDAAVEATGASGATSAGDAAGALDLGEALAAKGGRVGELSTGEGTGKGLVLPPLLAPREAVRTTRRGGVCLEDPTLPPLRLQAQVRDDFAEARPLVLGQEPVVVSAGGAPETELRQITPPLVGFAPVPLPALAVQSGERAGASEDLKSAGDCAAGKIAANECAAADMGAAETGEQIPPVEVNAVGAAPGQVQGATTGGARLEIMAEPGTDAAGLIAQIRALPGVAGARWLPLSHAAD